MTHARGQACRLCVARAEEISALKHIIAQQDERLIRMSRQHNEFREEMARQLERLTASTQLLQQELTLGRPHYGTV